MRNAVRNTKLALIALTLCAGATVAVADGIEVLHPGIEVLDYQLGPNGEEIVTLQISDPEAVYAIAYSRIDGIEVLVDQSHIDPANGFLQLTFPVSSPDNRLEVLAGDGTVLAGVYIEELVWQ